MGNKSTRIRALPPEEFTPEQKEIVGEWSVLNFSRVLANHPALYRVYVPFVAKVISFTDLPPRDRQVLVIRTLTQCGDVYEVTHHHDISYKVGMSDSEIDAIKTGGATLSEFDQVLIRAADELLTEFRISDKTWAALAEKYSSVELMEVVGLVGCYSTLAMMTKSFEMELEPKEETEKRLLELRTYT